MDLPGDSGRHDPQVLAFVVRENPGRVRAGYIRNVSRQTRPAAKIEARPRSLEEAGSMLVGAADTEAMAERAVRIGLVPQRAIAEITRTRLNEGSRWFETVHADPDGVSVAVSATPGEGGLPPNVVVGQDDVRKA